MQKTGHLLCSDCRAVLVQGWMFRSIPHTDATQPKAPGPALLQHSATPATLSPFPPHPHTPGSLPLSPPPPPTHPPLLKVIQVLVAIVRQKQPRHLQVKGKKGAALQRLLDQRQHGPEVVAGDVHRHAQGLLLLLLLGPCSRRLRGARTICRWRDQVSRECF